MKQFFGNAREACYGLSLLVLVGWVVAGCASAKQFTFTPLPQIAPGSSVGIEATNHFNIGDPISLEFYGPVDQLRTHQERVKEDGTITLPQIGVVKIAGKTPPEVQAEIRDRYVPRYYKVLTIVGPEIPRDDNYYVGGQVQRPGRYHYVGPTTVTKAIESAGGFTEFTKGTRVELLRNDGKRLLMNCKKAAEDPSLDLSVFPGDRISVPVQWVPNIPD